MTADIANTTAESSTDPPDGRGAAAGTPPARGLFPSAGPPQPHPRSRRRFTLDGSDALESHLTSVCADIASALRGMMDPARIELVLLGGGYGRGEGGVLRTEAGDRPYNDLEFYVFLRGNRHFNARMARRPLQAFGEIMGHRAGLDVEFAITSLRELRRAQVTMFSYDLVSGHRTVLGNESDLFGLEHHLDPGAIPVHEAARLMMNRCTGLLLAQERIQRNVFTPADADFVARNIEKARLAAGDAVLAALGSYRWSVTRRHHQLHALGRTPDRPWHDEMCRHHAAGTEFKLHPTRSRATRAELQLKHADIRSLCREVWLWIESLRLGQHFGSVDEYVGWPGSLWPDARPARNALVNLQAQGAPAFLRAHLFRHPRDLLLRALPLLLWHEDPLRRRATDRDAGSMLHTSARTFAEVVDAYRRAWELVR